MLHGLLKLDLNPNFRFEPFTVCWALWLFMSTPRHGHGINGESRRLVRMRIKTPAWYSRVSAKWLRLDDQWLGPFGLLDSQKDQKGVSPKRCLVCWGCWGLLIKCLKASGPAKLSSKQTKTELLELCQQRGLDCSGKKSEVVHALVSSFLGPDVPPDGVRMCHPGIAMGYDTQLRNPALRPQLTELRRRSNTPTLSPQIPRQVVCLPLESTRATSNRQRSEELWVGPSTEESRLPGGSENKTFGRYKHPGYRTL